MNGDNLYDSETLARGITIWESEENPGTFVDSFLNYIDNPEDYRYIREYCADLMKGIPSSKIILIIGDHAKTLVNSILLSDKYQMNPSIFPINTYQMPNEEREQYITRVIFDIMTISPEREYKRIYVK